MTMIKVADFLAVFKQHAVSLPVETIGEDHLASSSFGDVVDAIFCCDLVANTQADLALVWVSECVWLPNRHCTILTDPHLFHANQLM